MRFRVQLGGFLMMLGGMQMMTVRHFRMMRRLLVMAGFVVLGGFAMMFRGLFALGGELEDLVSETRKTRRHRHAASSSTRGK